MERKKWMWALCAVAVCLFAFATPAMADTQDAVTAEAYVVMDAQTGEVLLERGKDKAMYPASTTKIMSSALSFLRLRDNLDAKITVSAEAASVPEGSTAAYFVPGEEISVRDALNATLLISANDGANVLMQAAYGDVETGVAAMNETAAALGCQGTHFANAHGFYDENHYTTAYDLACITRWAVGLDGYLDFLGMTEYTMPATNLAEERAFVTQNQMLTGGEVEYPGIIGGKSGWTPESGYTEVEVADIDGSTVVCVVMNSAGFTQKYYDCATLFDAARKMMRGKT